MKKSLLILACAGLALATGCKQKDMDNPFLAEWNTPYGIPDFEKIKPEHYLPAFDAAMQQQNDNIDAIVSNSDAPSFANTIEALEYSSPLLNNVSSVFFNLYSSETSDEMETIVAEITPKLSAHSDNIMLNAALFEKVKAVYDQRESLGLDNEQMRLLEETYKSFIRGGIGIPADKQDRFRKINEQLSTLEMRFGQNVLKATNAYTLTLDETQLAGLSDGDKAAAKAIADKNPETQGKYTFTLHMPSWEPFMTNSSDRALRRQMWEAYSTRCQGGEFDNSAIIDSIVNLRLERANLLGFSSHAAYVLDNCLAKTPEAVYNCLMGIWTPALKKATQERDEYQKMLVADEGADAKLQPWDWRYYSEKLRKERYDLDDNVIRPYFSLDSVLQGAFDVATKLYGITFDEVDTLPTYNAEARSFLVKENNEVIAILYMDFFPRASKRSGAWMTNFREQYRDQEGNNVIPIVSIVCNFTAPQGDTPSLLNFDQAETLFHEFGHGLHGILSNCRYRSISGTNVPRDFVELPSQIMENWCRHPQVMKEYAKHYVTGETIPDTLIAKIEAAATYGQGFVRTELLAAALLDMDYHTLTAPQQTDATLFEQAAMDKIGLIPEIISRYKSPYFQHIFSGGYSAGYYSYTWTAILDADAFAAFEESGDLYNPELAAKFRHIISSGNTVDLMKLYCDFRGKEPNPDALLKKTGLR